jgi:hypothetical protein
MDILGLDDMVWNGISLFTIETLSSKGDVFVIEKKVKLKFDKQYYKASCTNTIVKENNSIFVEKKKRILLKRLMDIKRSTVKVFEDLHSRTRTEITSYSSSKPAHPKPKEKSLSTRIGSDKLVRC